MDSASSSVRVSFRQKKRRSKTTPKYGASIEVVTTVSMKSKPQKKMKLKDGRSQNKLVFPPSRTGVSSNLARLGINIKPKTSFRIGWERETAVSGNVLGIGGMTRRNQREYQRYANPNKMSISSNISNKNPIDLTKHPRLNWTDQGKVERVVLGVGAMYRANVRMVDWVVRYFSPRLNWEQKCPTKLILGAASTARRHEREELMHGVNGAKRRLRFWDEDQVERNLGRVGHISRVMGTVYEQIVRFFSFGLNRERDDKVEKNLLGPMRMHHRETAVVENISVRDYMRRLRWHDQDKAWLWNLRVKTIYWQNHRHIDKVVNESNTIIANVLKEQEKIMADTAKPYQSLSEPLMRGTERFKDPWNLN